MAAKKAAPVPTKGIPVQKKTAPRPTSFGKDAPAKKAAPVKSTPEKRAADKNHGSDTARVQIRFPEDLYLRLKARAVKMNVSIADLTNKAVQGHLDILDGADPPYVGD